VVEEFVKAAWSGGPNNEMFCAGRFSGNGIFEGILNF
jgi:hypothetical protein